MTHDGCHIINAMTCLYCGVHILLCLLSLSAGVSPVLANCPDLAEVTMRSMICLHPLTKVNNATLSGGLTEDNWHRTCREYNASLKCISDTVADCVASHAKHQEQLHTARSLHVTFRNGFGLLCENRTTFRLYLSYAGCYERHEEKSQACIRRFQEDFTSISKSDTNSDLEEDTHSICKIYKQLISCVNGVFAVQCSKGAARLFDELVTTFVPSQVMSKCTTEIAEHRIVTYDTKNSAVAHATPSLVVLYLTVICVPFHRGFNVQIT